MAPLADLLSARFGGAQAFFCNSGAEAIEAAIKYARKATGKPGIVALEGSFHGRTLGALSATGQPAKRAAFEPLVPGVTLRAAERRRLARGGRRPGHRADPDRAGPGRGRRQPGDAGVPRRRRASSPTSTVRSSASTRCRPASAGRARSSPSSSSASGRTSSRSPRGSRTACRSAPCSPPTTRRRLRAGRPCLHLRRQPGRLRRRLRGRRDGRRGAARERPRAQRPARRGAARCRGAGLLLGARDRPPGGRGRRRLPRRRPARHLGRPDARSASLPR